MRSDILLVTVMGRALAVGLTISFAYDNTEAAISIRAALRFIPNSFLRLIVYALTASSSDTVGSVNFTPNPILDQSRLTYFFTKLRTFVTENACRDCS